MLIEVLLQILVVVFFDFGYHTNEVCQGDRNTYISSPAFRYIRRNTTTFFVRLFGYYNLLLLYLEGIDFVVIVVTVVVLVKEG